MIRIEFEGLSRVVRLFDSHEIEYFLIGGWSVDIHLQKRRRNHSDLDIVIQSEDIEKAAFFLITRLQAKWNSLVQFDSGCAKLEFTIPNIGLVELFTYVHDEERFEIEGLLFQCVGPSTILNSIESVELNGVTFRSLPETVVRTLCIQLSQVSMDVQDMRQQDRLCDSHMVIKKRKYDPSQQKMFSA